ncbi:NADP-dependent 3-hydroxy acid dehydrogenase YdfG [Cognatiyoonia koreensis]|uniref:NADP-dependent 3-hydroxy acid dehydrogenase YdfG n=1 Tax=Cognatiyoonia koreensis TaxID=364200 RepID=A0A1I0NC39_9RHOB|nr:SDR family oxidoreductase [Cognatiyoonia koreensis]SEV98576.1 NADP-dependent 3-hydroxy acid dehydrogenase YdfG [Cognatiyoonia koreensis]
MASKTLFITGASSGIGAATAHAAVKSGWNVGLFARSADKVKELADNLGDAAIALPGDATDYSAQLRAIEKLKEAYGSIDAAFANAGMGVDNPGAEEGDLDEWEKVVDLNVMGLLKTVKATLPHLKDSKGHIVLTGSAAGRIHLSGSVYGATKWFVHGFGGNLAQEMKEWGGRCTVVAPGMVNTEFFDEPKPGKLEAEDVANAVMHALDAPERNNIREIFLMPRE